jgi:hypothetical protein
MPAGTASKKPRTQGGTFRFCPVSPKEQGMKNPKKIIVVAFLPG